MTKAKLREWRSIKLEHDDLLRRMEHLEYGLGAVVMDGLPRSGKISDPTAQQAVLHTELWQLYRQKVDELCEALTELEDAIQVLDSRERELIRLYYADGLTWEQVCVEISYSWRQTHNIHKRALEKLKEV